MTSDRNDGMFENNLPFLSLDFSKFTHSHIWTFWVLMMSYFDHDKKVWTPVTHVYICIYISINLWNIGYIFEAVPYQ